MHLVSSQRKKSCHYGLLKDYLGKWFFSLHLMDMDKEYCFV